MARKRDKSAFLFREEWLDSIVELNGEEALCVIKSIRSAKRGETIDFISDRYLSNMVKTITDEIINQEIACLEKSKKLSSNAQIRWEKTNTKTIVNKNESSTESQRQSVAKDNTSKETISSQQSSPTEDIFANHTEHSTTDAKKEDPMSNAKVGDIVVINGIRYVKRTKGASFQIPTTAEIQSYIKEKGYHFSAQTMFDHYECSLPYPWCRSNGKPIGSWKQCCATFEANVLRSEGQRAVNAPPPRQYPQSFVSRPTDYNYASQIITADKYK